MRASAVVLVVVFLVLLTGCPLRRQAKAAKTPPAPNPTAATAAALPPAPPPPISTPQTDVELPPPQPVSPEAMATIQPVPSPPLAEPVPTPRPVRRLPPAPKPEPAPPVAETPAPPAAAPAPAEDTPRLQAVVPDEERRRILADLDKRRVEIEGLLHHLNRRRLSSQQKDVVDRIRSFLTVADDYAKRGDMRSADFLSERALILARELVNAR